MKVLLADDELTIRITLADALADAGHDVSVADNGIVAKKLIDESIATKSLFDAVVSDIAMPGMTGRKLLDHVKAKSPGTEVILITGAASIDVVLDAWRAGAYYFIAKPFLNDEVLKLLDRIAEPQRLRNENEKLRTELRAAKTGQSGDRPLIGASPAMVELGKRIDAVAPSDLVVLIEGPTGTGKEVVARRIHELSARSDRPFIAVAGQSFTSSLASSELFGHVRGAFTGADSDREGVFERAAGGTIFIDDVDDAPLEIQAKLLRVLQERVIERVGEAGRTRPVDFRLVAATKYPLAEMVKDKEFREDFFMRLKSVVLKLPSLAQRREDIPLLIQHFIQKYGGGRELTLPPGLLDRLMRHGWPGNVRELEQTLKPCIELAKDGVLNEMFLDSAIGDAAGGSAVSAQPLPAGVDWPMLKNDVKELRVWLADIERAYIERAVELIGNKTGAAKALGIARKTLWQKLKEDEGQDGDGADATAD